MSAFLSCALLAAVPWTTIEAMGWFRADIDGTKYVPFNLPSGWTVAVENGNETHVVLTKSASIRKNQVGSISAKSSGLLQYTYRVRTTETLQDSEHTALTFTLNNFADTSVNNAFSTSSGGATASTEYVRSSVTVSNVMEKDNPVTVVKQLRMVYTGRLWTDLGSYKELLYDFGKRMTAYSHVTNMTMGGNMVACVASATSATRFIPTGMVFGNGGFSVPTDSFVKDADIDLYANGSLVDSFTDVITTPGSIDVMFVNLPTGTYDAFVRAESSVMKKITLSYTNGVWADAPAITLYYGDLNGDNVISQAEVGFVQANIGKNTSSTDWLDSSGNLFGWTPSMADIDGDGAVTSSDYNLVANNVGVRGDFPTSE